MVQCPQCKRLVDIPIPGDLQSFEEDGTVKMDIPFKPDEEEDRLAELRRAYLPRRQETDGRDIDLRVTMEQIEAAGTEEIPLELKDEVKPGAPKYDPETGELIRPMALKEDAYKKVIPIAPKVTLGYARAPDAAGGEVPAWRVPIELFRTGNLAVWGGLLLAHVLGMVLWMMVGGGLFFAAILVVFVYLMVLAHLSNVVEEIGHAGKDELPTPLRGLDFRDDIWVPCVNVAGALMLCYLPAFYALSPRTWVASAALALLGSFLFPAILMTLATSGTVFNLRPDRVFAVIGRCGTGYLFAVGLWIAAAGIYAIGLVGTTAWSMSLIQLVGAVKLPINPWLAFGLLVISFYMLHWFCWRVGLLYRAHHEQFPWILQQHVRSQTWQQYMMRRKPQYVQPAPLPVQQQQQQPSPAAPVKVRPVPVRPIPVQPIPPGGVVDDGPRRQSLRGQTVHAGF